MKSDKPTREKCVFCNEKSRKKQVIAFPKSALSKGFSYLCKRNIFLINNPSINRNIFLINNPSINQQDHEKAIRTFCGMRSCRM